jgi:chromosome segregation ATPase
LAEDEKDKAPTGSQTTNFGAGQDLLFGWLVGRAAADFGLAQVLAASEAQRVEQMKRLEDALLAQIHELQGQTNIGAPSNRQVTEFNDLKANLDSIAARLSQVEDTARQAVQTRDQLHTHAARLQSDLARQQVLYEAQTLRLQELTENLGAKFRGLEESAQRQAQNGSTAEADFKDLKVQLGAFTARLEQVEASSRRFESQAIEAVERLEELKSLELPRTELTDLAASVDQRLENTRRELGETMAARIAQELGGMRSRLEEVTRRLDSAPPEASAMDYEADRTRWNEEIDHKIAIGMRRLGEEIRQELRSTASGKMDQANFQNEWSALADRIAKAECNAQQSAERLAAEIDIVGRGLSRQQDRQQAADEFLKNVQNTLRTKLEEIEKLLVRQQDSFQQRDAQSTELKTEMQRLAQKMADLESSAHRTHALMVNENQQTAQLGESLRAEIDDLRGRLNEQPSLAGVMETVESHLSAKARELENQVAEKMLIIDRRDDEIHELKGQIRTINQKVIHLETAKPAMQSISIRPRESVVAPSETIAFKPASEERPNAAARPAGLPFGMPAAAEIDAGAKDRLLVEAGKDQITHLHERISADIERARAELREKSGRWKARR